MLCTFPKLVKVLAGDATAQMSMQLFHVSVSDRTCERRDIKLLEACAYLDFRELLGKSSIHRHCLCS